MNLQNFVSFDLSRRTTVIRHLGTSRTQDHGKLVRIRIVVFVLVLHEFQGV